MNKIMLLSTRTNIQALLSKTRINKIKISKALTVYPSQVAQVQLVQFKALRINQN
jgi:hypothetical protein